MKLVVCGNGMDLHLGFKTSYWGYRKFLEEAKFIQGQSAITLIEGSKFFVSRVADGWSDLENSLTFDMKKYVEELIFAYDRDIEHMMRRKVEARLRRQTNLKKIIRKQSHLISQTDGFLSGLVRNSIAKLNR